MPTRRDLLLRAPMLTAALLLGGRARAQGAGASGFAGLDSSYAGIQHRFAPRSSVGNVSGSALELPAFVHLAAGAPRELVVTFGVAIESMDNGRIVSASSDYLDHRHRNAGSRIEQATLDVAADVSNDQSIAVILAAAIARDLAVGNELVRNDAMSVSRFRIQMSVLRKQQDLLTAEERRAEGGGAIYLPIQSRVRRTGSAETERLEAEIARLRTELETVRRRAAELSSFILSN